MSHRLSHAYMVPNGRSDALRVYAVDSGLFRENGDYKRFTDISWYEEERVNVEPDQGIVKIPENGEYYPWSS